MANNQQIAEQVLAAVGGKANVSSVTHCMTRLRFVLVDESKAADDKTLEAIAGVLKVIRAGGQVQVVIGRNVDKVYDIVCERIGLEHAAQPAAEAELPQEKQKLTPKAVANNILGAVSGSLTPVLPVIIVAGIFKMVAVLFGPKNLGLLTAESQLYILCNLVNDAAFYFLPFFVAYSAAKRFKTDPILSMLVAALMLHPTMLDIVAAGEPFKIYGLLPMQLVNYTQATVPVILVVWILSYVHKWVKKVVPDFIRTIGVPMLTTFIMIPLTFCVFGPICNEIMSWVGSAILWMNNTIGVPTIVVVAAIWPFVIMFGMHVPVMMALLPTWMEMGYDAIVSPATIATNLAGIGVELAYALRAGSRENKELGWTCFVTHVTANISEPALYGIFLRDRKALAWDMLGAAAGGVTMGLLGGKVTLFSGVGFPFLEFLRFGEYSVPGAIGMVVAFGVSLALGLVFGFEKAQQKN